MAEVAPSTGTDAPADETPNQRLARQRREKRAAKMAEQGEDRLAKIKALNGGVAPPEEVLGGPTGTSGGPKVATVEDPDEVDISNSASGYGTPTTRQQGGQDPMAAAMFQQMQRQNQSQQAGSGGGEGGEEDPMVKMMQQMMGLMGSMGGQGQNPDDPNAKPPEVPPMLQALMAGGLTGKEQQAPPPATGSAFLWRVVHAVFAFILATYIALTSTFNGSKISRQQSVYTSESGYGFGPRLFLIFCTAELLLQSSRYFAEKGQLQGSGMLATVANSGVIPEPFAGYIRILGRYIGIAFTIFQDAMVVVFVFGCLAWWQGKATA